VARPETLEVGRVVKPHGLAGETVVELWTNRVERLAVGSSLTGPSGTLEVQAARPLPVGSSSQGSRWLVRFGGISTREAAEALRGSVLVAAPLDDPDSLWVDELVGSAVEDLAGSILGQVVAVESNPASDLLVLDGGGLVPLRFVVGRRAGVVVVDIPAGLLS
jgi:16S rRNA processing protein RimM